MLTGKKSGKTTRVDFKKLLVKLMKIVLFQVLKQKKYFLIFLVFSFAMAGFYPAIQVAQQGINNFFFWFSLLKLVDWIFYVVFCLLFGLSFSLFSWRNDYKVCNAGHKVKSGFFGGVGTFLSVTLPICPSCFSFLTLLLPVSFLGFLIQYRFWVMFLSAGLMFVSLVILGAFEKLTLQPTTDNKQQ